MGRIIGLIGCTCLVIAALRLTNLQHTDHTLKGGEDRVGARAKLSPREHFKHGKESFLRGRYQDALQHLEAVAATSTGLSGAERRQAEDYLSRARNRLQATSNGAIVRGQSDPFAFEEQANEPSNNERPSQVTEATRNRVEKLMTQAQLALQQGNRVEAIKLAQLANQLTKDAKLTFGKGEVAPANFLARLQGPAAAPTGTTTTAGWDSEEFPARGEQRGTAPRGDIRQIGAEVESPAFDADVIPSASSQRAASSSRPLTSKEQAESLISQAREDLKAGRYDEARRKALQADELDLTYDLFEDRPELLLADIDRHTETMTIARPTTGAPKSASPAVAMETPGSRATKGSATQATSASASPSSQSKKQQAIRLLELARQDIANGNLDGAQSKADEAAQLNVAYKLFEDMPELVLNEVAARRASEGLAQTDGPAPVKGASPTAKPQAKALLAKARQALEEGRIDEARQLAIEADRLKAPYDLFDDRPDIVLADIARAAKRGPVAVGPSSDSKTSAVAPKDGADPFAESAVDAPASTPKVAANDQPAARTNVTPAQAEAIEKLRQARQLIKAGRFDEARAKAEEAEAMNVSFPVFADRPDLVLADLNKKMAGADVATRKPVRDTGVTTADASNDQPYDSEANPFAPNTRTSNSVTAASGSRPEVSRRPSDVMSADAIIEVSPTGLSASELYNRGMAELNRGNRAGAYSAFLAAHQSGQKLDHVRTQRLQDYLRELAPKSARNGIQLANNQIEDSDAGMPSDVAEPTPLDAAQQEQMVKFDRLRSEVLNSVFKAERLRDTDPEAALTLIDQTMAKVEGAELPQESAGPLMKQLNKTRSSLQSEIVRQKPNIDLKNRNREVVESLEREKENSIRIEQEYAKLVEEFNELFKERRFAEAEITAKKAKELNPKDPTAETLFWKARLGRRVAGNEQLKLDKEESFFEQLNDVERAALANVGDKNPIDFGDDWKAITDRRKGKYRSDNRTRNEEDLRIEESLSKRISLHEDQVPLSDVVKKIQAVADVNIVLDTPGLEEEGVNSNTPVSIDVDGIQVKSALNLILGRYNLAYTIDNEVLKITSRIRQQGELVVATYPVADLVMPIPNFAHSMNNPFGTSAVNSTIPGIPGMGGAQMSVPPGGFPGMGQVGPNTAGGPLGAADGNDRLAGGSQGPDFNSLTDLLVSTIAPDSWDSVGGQASVRHYETTLSLVIRQTQKVHEEIADLLDQLRRLQDLQVTIEVRFVTVTDRFFERIGIDFDFGLQSTVGGPNVDNSGLPLQPFGSVLQPQFGLSGTNQAGQQQQGQQGQQGQQNQQGQTTSTDSFFTQGPTRQLTNRSNYPRNGTIVGMSQPQQFTQTLDIPFQQGSFDVGVPTFGGFNPKAGVEMGLAILSDVEAFFFIQAAQGDQRSNLLFAPKVTLFNGQQASVNSSVQRPFVISLIPTVGFFSTGFQPVIAFIPDGIFLTVTAVVSADRRFVRLTVVPIFSNITDVFTFSFIGGAGGNVQGGQQQGQQGGQQGGQGGGFGGGGQGGFGGQFGIGGGVGSMQIMQSLFTQQQQQGQQGQQNQRGNQNGSSGLSITVQQPVVETVTVNTTVSVPDGGTVLLGGVKRLREGRNMSGVPILNKIPYVSRLFKNTGVGRETESLMLMVTPRIIIQEEEEELLGIPRT